MFFDYWEPPASILRAHGAMVYDERILSWKGLDRASILTLKGRQIIPTQIGAYQETRLKRIRGQADLILRDNVFYLAVVVDAPEPVPFEATDFLGVDLGVKNIMGLLLLLFGSAISIILGLIGGFLLFTSIDGTTIGTHRKVDPRGSLVAMGQHP